MIAVGVPLAALLSIAGAFGRGSAVWMNAGHDPSDGTLTGYDRMAVEVGAALIGVDRNSERYREYEADIAVFSGKYYTYRVITLLHVVPAAVFFLLAPLQFVPAIRSRHLNIHRWSGRLLLILAIPLGTSGFFFGGMPFGGPSETIAVALAGGLFFYALARAFLAIRRGDVTRHREWMIRMMAVIVGIFTIRVVDLVIMRLVAISAQASFSPSVWIGWILTVISAEAWIQWTRPAGASNAGKAVPSHSPDAV